MHLITWLGIVWEGIRGKISITTPRIDKALHHIDNALQDPRLSARSLASIVGKDEPCSRKSRPNYDQTLPDVRCIVELQFWKNNLFSVNSKNCIKLDFSFHIHLLGGEQCSLRRPYCWERCPRSQDVHRGRTPGELRLPRVVSY